MRNTQTKNHSDARSFRSDVPILWNRLSDTLHKAQAIASFRRQLISHFFQLLSHSPTSASLSLRHHLQKNKNKKTKIPPPPLLHHLHQAQRACGCLHEVKLYCRLQVDIDEDAKYCRSLVFQAYSDDLCSSRIWR